MHPVYVYDAVLFHLLYSLIRYMQRVDLYIFAACAVLQEDSQLVSLGCMVKTCRVYPTAALAGSTRARPQVNGASL